MNKKETTEEAPFRKTQFLESLLPRQKGLGAGIANAHVTGFLPMTTPNSPTSTFMKSEKISFSTLSRKKPGMQSY